MNKLDEICAAKRIEVDTRKAATSTSDLDQTASQQSAPRGFAAALRRRVETGFALIAEV